MTNIGEQRKSSNESSHKKVLIVATFESVTVSRLLESHCDVIQDIEPSLY